MGFISFIKNGAKTIGHNVAKASKVIGKHVAPAVEKVSGIVKNVAPIAGVALGAMSGNPDFIKKGADIGRIAGKVHDIAGKTKHVANGVSAVADKFNKNETKQVEEKLKDSINRHHKHKHHHHHSKKRSDD